MATHDLHKFMKEASDEIASEYERIYANAASDPGSAGDEGERNWAHLLKKWLPPEYHVATKGRLMGRRGELSPQVDVVVLKPGYPPGLRDKAVWLAGGVAAVFECKNTLTSANVKESVQRAVKFKELFTPELGSPRRELKSPLFYGLLAHSHSWKSPGSKAGENVSIALQEESCKISHPRHLIDYLCVADLGIWKYGYMAAYKSGWQFDNYDGDFDFVMTSFVESTITPHAEKGVDFHPIGSLIYAVVRDLAWKNVSLRDIADYYKGVSLGGMGHGTMRPWPLASVYSPTVVEEIRRGRPINGEPWNEWSMGGGTV